jgi:hypothetical protein
MKRMSAGLMAAALLASACDAASDPTSSTGPIPTTSAGDDTPFTLIVEPGAFSPVMAGQRCVVLVSIEGGTGAASTTAVVTGPATVEPTEREIGPGEVVEFTVVPGEPLAGDGPTVETVAPEPIVGGDAITLDLVASRGSRQESASLSMEVVEWVDDLEPLASDLRDRFVAYLEENRPELGITSRTVWTPSITKPQILVVMHYLFFSNEWEMGITWHVTVPEHAWSHMYLRARDELRPSIGLEIPSWVDPGSQPGPWDPPAEVDR